MTSYNWYVGIHLEVVGRLSMKSFIVAWLECGQYGISMNCYLYGDNSGHIRK